MYIVGFIDDDRESYVDYYRRLLRKDIKLLYPDGCKEMHEIIGWIVENNIECIIVDYKLKHRFPYQGTDLVAYLNGELPDLPCIILTNYPEESISENLVISSLIEDRDVLAADDIEPFTQKIKQSVEVFQNRIQKHINEYTRLLDLKKQSKILGSEEERFQGLYKLLRAYGEIDDIPTELLNTEVNKKLDEILGRVSLLIENTEKR